MTIPLDFILLPLAAVILYWRVLNGEAVYDDANVLDSAKNLAGFPLRVVVKQYRFLSSGVLAVLTKWPGTRRGYHVVNVVVHAATAIVLKHIALGIGTSEVHAWLVALVFLLHPFAVNTVGYISGFSSLFSTLLGMLSVLVMLQHHPLLAGVALILTSQAKQDGLAFALTVGAIAVWSGERQIIFPLVVVGILILPAMWPQLKRIRRNTGERTHVKDGLPPALPPFAHFTTVLIKTFALLPFWCLGFKTSPKHGGGVRLERRDVLLACGTIVLCGVLFYVEPLAGMLILFGPWLAYLVVPIHEAISEVRNYAMIAGFALACADAPLMLTVVILAFFFDRTWTLIPVWRTAESFWIRATQSGVGEKSHAWQELGTTYKLAGQPEKAEPCYWRAIALNPKLAGAMKNLAWTLVGMQRFDEGLAMMEQCVKECPHYEWAWEELAMLYQSRDRLDDAVVAIRRALELTPRAPSMVNRLGILLYQAGYTSAALEHFKDAVNLAPKESSYIFNLGLALKAMGLAEADAYFNQLPRQMRLTPDMIPPVVEKIGVAS